MAVCNHGGVVGGVTGDSYLVFDLEEAARFIYIQIFGKECTFGTLKRYYYILSMWDWDTVWWT